MKESDEEAYAPPKPEESGIPLRKPLTIASDATHPRPLLVEVHAESPVATPKETGETGPRSFAPPVPEVGENRAGNHQGSAFLVCWNSKCLFLHQATSAKLQLPWQAVPPQPDAVPPE